MDKSNQPLKKRVIGSEQPLTYNNEGALDLSLQAPAPDSVQSISLPPSLQEFLIQSPEMQQNHWIQELENQGERDMTLHNAQSSLRIPNNYYWAAGNYSEGCETVPANRIVTENSGVERPVALPGYSIGERGCCSDVSFAEPEDLSMRRYINDQQPSGTFWSGGSSSNNNGQLEQGNLFMSQAIHDQQPSRFFWHDGSSSNNNRQLEQEALLMRRRINDPQFYWFPLAQKEPSIVSSAAPQRYLNIYNQEESAQVAFPGIERERNSLENAMRDIGIETLEEFPYIGRSCPDCIIIRFDKLIGVICQNCCRVFRECPHFSGHSCDIFSCIKFLCRFCPRQFEINSEYVNHEILHLTGFRPIPCFACGQSYRDIQSLKRHILNYCHFRGLHVCPICQKRFTRSYSLKRHVQFHQFGGYA